MIPCMWHHQTAVKHIMRYLKGTIYYEIMLKASSTMELNAFSDSSWANCPDDRCSISGLCIFLSNNLIL